MSPGLNQRDNKAQTAIELAVFGAVLIFVLGLIVRQAVNASYSQNQVLKAMRLALSESFKNTQDGKTARNTASILLIEDRLSPDPGKYGPIDRVPYILPGSGTFSNQLFQPILFGELENLPVFDLFINGQHFTFTTAGFVEYDLSLAAPGNIALANWVSRPPDHEIEKDCRKDRAGMPVPCRKLYTKIPNFDTSELWCDDITPPRGTLCVQKKNLPVEERFDLNRDDGQAMGSNEPKAGDSGPDRKLLRPQFSWQWYAVLGIEAGKGREGDTSIKDDGGKGVDVGNSKNIFVDVDGDKHEEHILTKDTSGNPGVTSTPQGVLTRVKVIDFQAGDLDFSRDDYLPGEEPGLKDNIVFYAFTREGTMLLIEEGELLNTVNPDYNKVKRSTQRREHIDFIERTVLLSNDTGRFCHHPGRPGPDDDRPCLAGDPPLECVPNKIVNPGVEACNGCSSDAKNRLTCYDVLTKKLFVRSRISNLGGRKWVTPNVYEPGDP